MRLLSLAVCLVVLSACPKSVVVAAPHAEPQQTAAEFFALIPGAAWSYEVELLGSKSNIEVKMIKQNAEGFFEDSNGAAFLVDAFGVRDQKRYLLRNPVEVGTSWTNVVSVSSIERYQVLSVGQPCLTRAGSWPTCVVVESRNRVDEGRDLVNEYTLAPGVGIVRLATMLDANGQRIPQSHLELVKFVRP
jgi:hypothetical protein